MEKEPKARNKAIYFIGILVGVGFVYPVIMTGIFKFNFKASMIIGAIFGVVAAVLWLVTANIREKKRAAGNTPSM